jgi:hypothetical protein
MATDLQVLRLLILSFIVTSPSFAAETFSVAAVGDIMLGTDYPTPRLPSNDGRDYLTEVASVLQAADVSFGNLEGVLADGGEARKRCKIAGACYLFRSPARYAGHLSNAGFDVLSLANNHARDFGEAGRSLTMSILDNAGIRHSGRRGDIASWQQGGKRWAMIAFSPTLKSHLLNDIPSARRWVEQLVAHHDIVIVSFHGGAEGADASQLVFEEEFYFGETRGEVVRFAHTMVEAGADLVLGHGPHVVRAMELYEQRLIAYSLGNFATAEGISVAGASGLAPILKVTITEDGQFLDGQLYSAIQRRPARLGWDPLDQAATAIRQLTVETFGPTMFEFTDDNRFRPGAINTTR